MVSTKIVDSLSVSPLKKKKRHKNQPQPGLHLTKSLAVAGQIYSLQWWFYNEDWSEASVSGPSNHFSVKSKELTLIWRSPNVSCDHAVEATPQGEGKWWGSQAGRPCAPDSLSFLAASDTAFLGEDLGSQGLEHVCGPCCHLPICLSPPRL